MDDLGNRLEVNLKDGSDEVYDVNDIQNQYMVIDTNSLEYDAAGNLTTDHRGYQYTYDYENRIIEIKDSANNDIAEFAYDALGRRIKKYDAIADETTLYYYNENQQVLAEYDGGGNFKKMNVFGNYIDELLYRRSSAGITRRFYVHDHLYSPVASIKINGTISERYEYDAYGNCTIWDSGWTTERSEPADTVNYPNPYLFTGRRIDYLDSGDLPLMYYRHRYYDTYTGRFLQHDLLGYVDGMNLYAYVRSNPSNSVDPLGYISKYDECLENAKKNLIACKVRGKVFCWVVCKYPPAKLACKVCKLGYKLACKAQKKCDDKWCKEKEKKRKSPCYVPRTRYRLCGSGSNPWPSDKK